MRWLSILLLVVVVGASRGDSGSSATRRTTPPTPVPSTTASTTPEPAAGCADVIAAEAVPKGDSTYLFRVTVRSADTGPEKYADVWEVRAPDGTVLGERVLLHDHAGEQPFTRTLGGVAVPAGVAEVVVAARDSVEGFCGAELPVPIG